VRVRVLGVDGCRGGWVVASVDGGKVAWRWSESFAGVIDDPAEAIAVDIPIGLPDAGSRRCDIEGRIRVGPRRSSVFPAPRRPMLATEDYAAARQLLASTGAGSMSAQAYAIVAAIRSVDQAITSTDESRIIEVHPEVSFAALAGDFLPKKKSAPGVARRIEALARWVDAADALRSAPEDVPVDDALDALACAWSAQRWSNGHAEVLGDGARDARGLIMRIVV
jgi:predicted RNase H-like nuclease